MEEQVVYDYGKPSDKYLAHIISDVAIDQYRLVQLTSASSAETTRTSVFEMPASKKLSMNMIACGVDLISHLESLVLVIESYKMSSDSNYCRQTPL